MSENHADKSRPAVIISAVGEDGTIIETVYRTEAAQTALVVARGGEIAVVPRWRSADSVYVSVKPGNNLIKHQALLFPSAAIEYDDTVHLLEDIEKYIRRYVSLSDQAMGLSSAYVLLSWVYDAFNELPYLRFRGDYGTGKTRALLVIGSLCYKAFFASGASTVSPIFHTLDTFKGTLIFDEADFRFTDEKAELVKILNNGNARGFPVLRNQATPSKEFDPRAFVIFGPKIVGMRRSYEDRALESRFVTVEMEPGRASAVPINLPEAQKEEALVLRNKLLMYRLRNRLTVALDPSLADSGLEPRMNQILLPLLSIVPDEGRRTVIRESIEVLQARVVAERSGSAEGHILDVMVRLLASASEPRLPLTDITAAFAREHGGEYDRHITNRWVASVLRRLGVILYKSNGVSVLMPGQEERIAALRVRYGVGEAAQEAAARAA